ncbi:MAG: helix-turn-helix transcriptional regulator [Parcubacteria group bacterium]|nr:helix-turn-helix transcriptional regulator [Parcubacteria group bacterium]
MLVLYFVKYLKTDIIGISMKSPCPITEVAELLSDTWTMLIMHHLIEGSKKFCELERALPGISTRTLTNKLKRLAEVDLLVKTDEGLYAVTHKGKGLRIVENAMKRYQEQYL